MNFSKSTFLVLNFLLVALISSCSNSKNMTADQQVSSKNIEFTEERRLNHKVDLKETTIVNSPNELVGIYAKMEDPKIPRSAPIPAFDENTESILIIKPKLKSLTYGDIEIQKIEKYNDKLQVNYIEVENKEYAENKSTNPIVVLRVTDKPSEIILNKTN